MIEAMAIIAAWSLWAVFWFLAGDAYGRYVVPVVTDSLLKPLCRALRGRGGR